MAGQFPLINNSFETASQDLITERRACYVIEAFTTGTFGRTFDAHQFQASLCHSEEHGEYVMDIELLPDASDRNGENLNDLADIVIKNIRAIRDEIVAGSHEPFMMDIKPAQRGFVLLTPDLKDFTTIYARISKLEELNWDDPKFCAEFGREYSLVDLQQVIALLPDADHEGSYFEMDRALDMGLPKPRLQ